MSTLAQSYSNSHLWWMIGLRLHIGTPNFGVRHLWMHTLGINHNCSRGRRKWCVKRSCPEWRKELKHCWWFVCFETVLRKPGPAFLWYVARVVGSRQSDVVQTDTVDKPKHIFQLVRSDLHPNIYISLVVDICLFFDSALSCSSRCDCSWGAIHRSSWISTENPSFFKSNKF